MAQHEARKIFALERNLVPRGAFVVGIRLLNPSALEYPILLTSLRENGGAIQGEQMFLITQLNRIERKIDKMSSAISALTTAVSDLTAAVATETANVNAATASIAEAVKELAASNDPAVAALAAQIEEQVASINSANSNLQAATATLPTPPAA